MNNIGLPVTIAKLQLWLPQLWEAAGKPEPTKYVSWRRIANNMVNFGITLEQLGPIFIQLKSTTTKNPMWLITKSSKMWQWQKLYREYNGKAENPVS